MNKILLILATLFLSACEILIEDLDGSIVIIVKEAGVDAEMLDAAVDSSVDMDASHENDTGVVDSAVDMDATVDAGSDSAVDASHMHEAGMDSAVVDSGHVGHDAMVMQDSGIVLPDGSLGFSGPRIASTTEAIGGPNDVGAFRTECAYSHMNYDDPLVYPGQSGRAHLHTFFGNSSINAFSDLSNLRNVGNSTCRGGTLNRSAYWIPTLMSANNTPLVPTYVQFYYKSGYQGVPAHIIQPHPQGLRILAGYDDRPETNGQWGCLDNYRPYTDTIQNCPDGDKVLMIVTFPQCWDGVRLDSPNHRDHMAYSRGSAGCPTSHPIPLVQITFNIGWDVRDAAGARLSSDIMLGTAPGVSAHADWVDGWDHNLVKQWVDACINSYGDCKSHLVGNSQMIY